MDKEDFTNKIADNRDNSRQDDPEEKLWKGDYSSKDMYGSFGFFGFLSIAAIVAGFFFFWMFIWIIAAVVILWVILLARLGLRKLGVHYELTTQRLIHEKGILKRVTDRIEVIDIDDVTYEQGILDRMFNVGTIKITSSDTTHPVIELEGIENVKEVADMMDKARRKERIRRGLHIEAI